MIVIGIKDILEGGDLKNRCRIVFKLSYSYSASMCITAIVRSQDWLHR